MEQLHFSNEQTVTAKSVDGVIELACDVDSGLMMVWICVYRRGSGSINLFLETLESVLIYICKKYVRYKLVIGGDFNINLFEQNENTNNFLDLLNTFILSQCIFEPL